MSAWGRLALDGKVLPMKGVEISFTQQLAGEDASGDSSEAAIAEQGNKPKSFAVSGHIPFSRPDDLKAVMKLAEATGKDGTRTHYVAQHPLIDALAVKKVAFKDTVQVSQDGGGQLKWLVQFTLAEYDPAAAAAEAKKKAKAKAAAGAGGTGGGVAARNLGAGESGTGADDTGADAALKPEGTLENALAKIDSWIGGAGDEGGK